MLASLLFITASDLSINYDHGPRGRKDGASVSRSDYRALVQLLPLQELPAVLVGHLGISGQRTINSTAPPSAPLCFDLVQSKILLDGLRSRRLL